jgi:hypothetical protein
MNVDRNSITHPIKIALSTSFAFCANCMGWNGWNMRLEKMNEDGFD